MFSKELENIIQATLEDGILEDYEKVALQKRAQAEGVDLTELEIYINSILQKRKRELVNQKKAEYEALEKQKTQVFGKVCPACGKQVSSLALNCECGYEFKKDHHVSAVQVFSEKISKIQSRPLKGEPNTVTWDEDKKLREQEVLDAITMFPVPNTKEDIMEFLALAAPNSKFKGGIFGTLSKRFLILGILLAIIVGIAVYNDPGDGRAIIPTCILGLFIVIIGALLIDRDTLKWNKKATVWRAKFEQVLMKGRSLRSDSEFTQMLDYYEKQVK